MKPRKSLVILEYAGILALLVAIGIVAKPKVDEISEGLDAARSIQRSILLP